MVNPLDKVYEWFLQFLDAIPAPVMFFVLLSFALFAISTIVNMIFRS